MFSIRAASASASFHPLLVADCARLLRGKELLTSCCAGAALTSQPVSTSSRTSTSGKPSSSTRMPILDFSDTETAFQAKTTAELVRQILVLQSCRLSWLVNNADAVLNLSYKLLGKTITNTVVRHTFFKHFVAGEDGDSIQPAVQRLRSAGIGSILDYAAEDDVVQEGPTASRTEPHDTVVARTYQYQDEQKCDAHMKVFQQAIEAAARQHGEGFAAIKLTALGKPFLLERVSSSLVSIRDLFNQFDIDHDKVITKEEFRQVYTDLFSGGTDERMEELFDYLDVDHKGTVDYVSWTKKVRVQDAPVIAGFCRSSGPFTQSVLSDTELQLLDNMMGRLTTLVSQCAQSHVRVMVDAEHSYFQPCIDHVVVEMQRRHNTQLPIVFNTYQCYLKDSQERLLIDLERAEREGFKFGAKLVRGAYMHLERARAQERGYESPIWDTIEETHDNYNKCVSLLLEKVKSGRAEVMIASHNQESVELAVEQMQGLGLHPSSGVYFGQLLGMADHLSYSLGAKGYKAFKYVPFGPIDMVMPYLIRRAQENSSVMGGVKHEINLVEREIWRRFSSQSHSTMKAGTVV